MLSHQLAQQAVLCAVPVLVALEQTRVEGRLDEDEEEGLQLARRSVRKVLLNALPDDLLGAVCILYG